MEVKGEMTKLDKRMNKSLGQGRGLSSRDKSSTLEDLIYAAKRDSLHSEADLGETHISWEDMQRKSNAKPFVSHTNCGCSEKSKSTRETVGKFNFNCSNPRQRGDEHGRH